MLLDLPRGVGRVLERGAWPASPNPPNRGAPYRSTQSFESRLMKSYALIAMRTAIYDLRTAAESRALESPL